jgi:hypothetical protein
MRPTRWRRSTHVVIGVAVLLLVAAVVGVAAVLTTGNSTSDQAIKPALPRRPLNRHPAVADSATKPDATGWPRRERWWSPNLGACREDPARDHRRSCGRRAPTWRYSRRDGGRYSRRAARGRATRGGPTG